MILNRCLLHPTPWVVCFTVSKFQVNRLRRLPLSSQIRWSDFNICMLVACRFTGDTVAYTLPAYNRPPPTVHNCSSLSSEPLGATITQETPFTSHSTQPWTFLSPIPPIALAACSSFVSSHHDLRFPPLVATCGLALKPILSCRGPKTPDPSAPLAVVVLVTLTGDRFHCFDKSSGTCRLPYTV